MKSGHGKAIPYHAMFDSAFRKDPFPFYAYLRGTAPVIWDDVLQAWVVTHADDVQSILRDAKTFSSNRVSLGRARFSDPELESLFDTIERLMLQRDEPDHTRLRRLVTHAFQKAAIESYAPRVRDLARELIDPRLTTGQIEFVADYAVPLPILVISEILGIPPEDRARVKQWCDDFSIVALNFYAKITDDQLHAGREAVAAFSTYLADQIAARRGQDGIDLLSFLVEAEEAGERLTFDELLANTVLLLNAGNETTSILLVNALHILATQPDVTAALRGDPTLIPQAVEECLRFTPPVHFLGRILTRDTTMGGETLRKGDLVMVFLGSAGRDEARFDHADRFELARTKVAQLSFGSGPHVCAGLQLARLEGCVTIETMLRAFSDIRLATTDLSYAPNLNLRCFERLPLKLTPA